MISEGDTSLLSTVNTVTAKFKFAASIIREEEKKEINIDSYLGGWGGGGVHTMIFSVSGFCKFFLQ